MFRRGEVAQKRREHRHVGQLLERKVRKRKRELHMHHAVRLRVRAHNCDSVRSRDFGLDHRRLGWNIPDGEHGELRGVFGPVRRGLVRLERAAFGQHLVELLLRPAGLHLRERRLLGCGVLGGESARGNEGELGAMRVLDEGLAQQALEPAVRDLRAERGEARGVAEGVRRIAAVEPEVEGVGEEGEATRGFAEVLLAVAELGAVEKRGEARMVEALLGEGDDRLAHGAAHFVHILILHVLGDKRDLELGSPAHAHVNVLAEALREKRLLEGRLVRARKRVREHIYGHALLALVEPAEHPRVAEDHLALLAFGGADLVLHRLLRRDRLLVRDLGVNRLARIGLQKALELREHGLEVDAPVEENARVRRVVEAVVEIPVALEVEGWDGGRVAARDEAVARLRIEHAAQLVVEAALRRGERALHLAVHDAIAGELAVGRC